MLPSNLRRLRTVVAFVGMGGTEDKAGLGQARFNWSHDGGRSWKPISKITNPPGGYWGGCIYLYRYGDTLLTGVSHPNHVFDESYELVSGGAQTNAYRSMIRWKPVTDQSRYLAQ